MNAATEIVVNGEQGLNLAAKAFLLIDRRFHGRASQRIGIQAKQVYGADDC